MTPQPQPQRNLYPTVEGRMYKGRRSMLVCTLTLPFSEVIPDLHCDQFRGRLQNVEPSCLICTYSQAVKTTRPQLSSRPEYRNRDESKDQKEDSDAQFLLKNPEFLEIM